MTMTKDRANQLKPLLDAIIERAEGLELKGKKRDYMALDMVLGAQSVQPAFNGIVLLVSVRGYREIVDLSVKVNETLEA